MCPPAPMFLKPRRRYARLDGRVVERIAIARNGKVEVRTDDGQTLHVDKDRLTNLNEGENNGN